MSAVRLYRVTGSAVAIVVGTHQFTPDYPIKLLQLELHLSSVGATAENFVCQLDSPAGTIYDTVLFTQDMNTVTDLLHIFPGGGAVIVADEVVTFAYTNTDGSDWGLKATFEEPW